MIDIENEVFDGVAQAVEAEFPEASVAGEYVRSPSVFPHVSIVESDNSAYIRTQTSSSTENHAELLYTVDVYSNKSVAKKRECRAILAVVDRSMGRYGFTRIMCQPIPNLDDATVYRMTARYRAVASQETVIYRR